MTRHRLIRSTIPQLMTFAEELHPRAMIDIAEPGSRHWFAFRRRPADATLWWCLDAPFGRHRCWLELEQGACAVLAHLTVASTADTRQPRHGLRVAVADAWAARQLRSLAQRAETATAA